MFSLFHRSCFNLNSDPTLVLMRGWGGQEYLLVDYLSVYACESTMKEKDLLAGVLGTTWTQTAVVIVRMINIEIQVVRDGDRL